MRILTAEACRAYMAPMKGAMALSINLMTEYGQDQGGPYWSAHQVRANLDWLQGRFPLGFLPVDFTVALPALRLYYVYDMATGMLAEQMDGVLDLHRRVLMVGEIAHARSLAQLLGHEFGHAVWRRFVRMDDVAVTPALEAFCRICAINPVDWPENGLWHRRLREYAAEAFLQALWGLPCRDVFPTLSGQQRTALRMWVMDQWPVQTLAPLEIVDSQPAVHIYPDGATTVDGMGVAWPADQKPRLLDGRFFMGLRAIMERVVDPLVRPYGLQAGITWEDQAQRAVPWVRTR